MASEVIPALGYTINFDALGGTVDPSVAQTDKYGKLATLPIPTRSGYRFIGWFDQEKGGSEITAAKVFDDNITIYAHWSSTSVSGGAVQSEYIITVAKADNGSANVSQKEASAGTMITVSVAPASGYKEGAVTATDYYGNKLTLKSAGANKYTFIMPSSDVKIKAEFVKANGNSTVDVNNAIIMQIGNKNIIAYGKTIISDVAPLIVNNRTLVPIRIVTETLGGTADWNADTKVVTLNIDGKTINMQIGVALEKYGVAPIIIDNRTFVPIRFVAEELGADVEWLEKEQTVVITKNKLFFTKA